MDNKAKINARNEDEDTSLHLAAKNGKIRYTHSNLKKKFLPFPSFGRNIFLWIKYILLCLF